MLRINIPPPPPQPTQTDRHALRICSFLIKYFVINILRNGKSLMVLMIRFSVCHCYPIFLSLVQECRMYMIPALLINLFSHIQMIWVPKYSGEKTYMRDSNHLCLCGVPGLLSALLMIFSLINFPRFYHNTIKREIKRSIISLI